MKPFTPTLSAVQLSLLGFCMGGTALAQTTPGTPADLGTELRAMREEIRQLRTELDTLRKRQAQSAPLNPGTAAAGSSGSPGTGWSAEPRGVPAQAPNATPQPSALTESASATSPVSLFGYGEMNFSRPRNASESTATVRRGVLGFAYRFNDRTRMAAELEVENAVVSAGDQGEVAFEQMYIEHDLSDTVSVKSGLFLIPMGTLNESHEPTRYFGVERNLVETAIIPSTWREMGLGVRGTTAAGLRWDAGVVTSFDLGKWDATSSDGKASPLGAIHQEGQLAKARSLGAYAALNYNGLPGFNVGGSVFNGGVGHKQTGFAAPDASVVLGEVHTRWQPGKWDLSALAAMGGFSGVGALNATFAGQATPVPTRFGGWYTQAAYRLWQRGDYSAVPFTRYERVNTARSYDGLPTGLAPSVAPDTRVWTGGVNLYLNPQVVFKADVQRYLNDRAKDRLNIGMGFHF